MTFRDCIDRVVLEMGCPAPSSEEIQSHITHAYGLSNSTFILASYDFIRTLVEGTVWSMEESWQRDKFERLIRLGP